ncbi:MAG: glycyl-radical enzyme activating protein [Acidobacteriota bacterium]
MRGHGDAVTLMNSQPDLGARPGTERPPLLFEIKGNSLDDGPGIRTVVFFKGCPLRCRWCHNPEGMRAGPEISYDAGKCASCDQCIALCPKKALARDNPHFVDRERCDLCGECFDQCPSGALRKVGLPLPVETVVEWVLSDRPFFDNSGGGVTLSGGEPCLYMHYVSLLAAQLHEHGIHVLLETCGWFDYERFRETVLPHLDMIYYDIKLFDSAPHREYCGVPNSLVLDNFTRLLRDAKNGRPSILPRTPLVPGITDTEANLRAIAGFLRDQGVRFAALLAYNPLWPEKSRSLGTEPGRSLAAAKFMSRDEIERCRRIFAAAGVET